MMTELKRVYAEASGTAHDTAAHDAGLRAVAASVRADQLPCDGGCNYNSGPEEMCSAHGRPVSEVWKIAQDIAGQRHRYRIAIDEVLDLVGDIGPEARRILTAAIRAS